MSATPDSGSAAATSRLPLEQGEASLSSRWIAFDPAEVEPLLDVQPEWPVPCHQPATRLQEAAGIVPGPGASSLDCCRRCVTRKSSEKVRPLKPGPGTQDSLSTIGQPVAHDEPTRLQREHAFLRGNLSPKKRTEREL